jgi:hypothetical protein
LPAAASSQRAERNDGANAGDAGADARPPTGYFFVTQSWIPADFFRPRTYQSSVYGTFGETLPLASHTCAQTTVGECIVGVCNSPAGSQGDPYQWPPSLNAGSITVASPLGSYVVPYRRGAASGTGTIPAAVLGELQKTEGKSGSAQYVPQNEVHFQVGRVATTVFVQGNGAGGGTRVL